MSPEAAESVVLAVAAGWMLRLHWIGVGRVAGYAALYLALPAVGLGMQALGLVAMLEAAKWIIVAVNLTITASMIAATRRADSPTVRAMVETARGRGQERRDAAEAVHLAELRGRAHALADLLRSDLAAA